MYQGKGLHDGFLSSLAAANTLAASDSGKSNHFEGTLDARPDWIRSERDFSKQAFVALPTNGRHPTALPAQQHKHPIHLLRVESGKSSLEHM